MLRLNEYCHQHLLNDCGYVFSSLCLIMMLDNTLIPVPWGCYITLILRELWNFSTCLFSNLQFCIIKISKPVPKKN